MTERCILSAVPLHGPAYCLACRGWHRTGAKATPPPAQQQRIDFEPEAPACARFVAPANWDPADDVRDIFGPWEGRP